jgi:hypothetical protein
MVRKSIGLWLMTLTGLLMMSAATTTSYADPPGTVSLSEPNVPPVMRVRGATEVGLAYEIDSPFGGASQLWLKAPGAAPVTAVLQPQTRFAMAGRMLFDDEGTVIRYAFWNGPAYTCPGVPLGEDKAFVPTGWTYVDAASRELRLVDATPSGCSTRVLSIPTGTERPYRVLGADATGVVVEFRPATGPSVLRYFRYDDPGHPVQLATTGQYAGAESEVRAGALLVSASVGAPGSEAQRLWRVPVDGSPATQLPVSPPTAHEQYQTGATTVSGSALIGYSGMSVVGVGDPEAYVLPGVTGAVASDGTSFYTTQAAGEPAGIYARVAEPWTTTRVVPLPATRYQSQQWAIALSPGRVYYTNATGPELDLYMPTRYDVKMRSLSTGPGTVSVGPEQPVRDDVSFSHMSASAGRLVFDGNWQRTYTGQIRQMNTRVAAPPEASGNRWLIRWNFGTINYQTAGRSIYDVRTGRTAGQDSWPQGPQDLFGNYLLYARPDGSVRLRNLVTGSESVSRGAGSPIEAVALHSRWAAWVTQCRYVDNVCTQVLTLRDMATGHVRNYNTRKTTSLDMSGGYLGFDAQWYTDRLLRVVHADDGAVTVIGTLPRHASDGSDWQDAMTPPRHFDLEDEVIGWLDVNHTGRLAHLAPTIDPPRYLGNAIAPGTFRITSPTSAESTAWTIALPVSKALPRCTLRIYRGSVLIRTLNCATATGMVSVTWNGLTSGGIRAPVGTYRWQVSGTDDDGYWLRNYDGRLTTITGTMTGTAS